MVEIGVIAARGTDDELAERLAGDLPDRLGERFPQVDWQVEAAVTDPADPSAEAGELSATVRRRMLDDDWDLAVGLTSLPLKAGRRPVSATANSATRVGLVSIPALGALQVERRASDAVLHVVEGLLGEHVDGDGGDEGRDRRIAGRLAELSSPLGQARTRDDGTLRFATATVRGNLRLLIGMVRGNQPTRIVARLSRALVGALGTGAFALASSNVWKLADGTSWARLVVVSLLCVVATVLALVLAHGLWERAIRPEARERVALFNLAMVATLVLAVLTLYLALFTITLVAGAALIPPDLMTAQVGHAVGVPDYLQLGLLVAALATIGGALGSVIERDISVREAANPAREDERTEAARSR